MGKEEQILGKAQLKRATNNKSKPAWALTENQKDQLEDEEADDEEEGTAMPALACLSPRRLK